jgi:hypothetical protein
MKVDQTLEQYEKRGDLDEERLEWRTKVQPGRYKRQAS